MNVAERIITEAKYLVENKATIRATAEHFGISKSTAHQDLSRRLRTLEPVLYKQVKSLLRQNFEEKHIRGGASTKRLYKQCYEKNVNNSCRDKVKE